MEQSELDYWRNPMLLKLFYSFMDIFTVFSTFDIDKLGKICQCYWKKCLNISKIAKYQSDTTSYVLNRDIVRPFWQIRTRVHMVAKSSYKVTFLLSFNTYLSSFMGLFTLERDVKKSFQGLVIIYVEGGREKRWGVKAISDWLEGGGAKLFYKEV